MSDDNVIEFPSKRPDVFGYMILYARTVGALNDRIEEHINKGWRPFGAAFVGSLGRGYCQGMIWETEVEFEVNYEYE